MHQITTFSGQYKFLSNFYSVSIHCGDLCFASVEHAYQAMKVTKHSERRRFLGITAAQAKRRGRQVEIRSNWEEIKLDIMFELLNKKFCPFQLCNKLVQTHPFELIEGNYWGDTFWGVCGGIGENHLGKLLMQIREKRIKESKPKEQANGR